MQGLNLKREAAPGAGLEIPESQSFAEVHKTKETWRAISSRLEEIEKQIKVLEDEKSAPARSIEERADMAVRGEAIAVQQQKPEALAALRDERRVLSVAVSKAKAAFDEARGAAGAEVLKRLAPKHQTLVRGIASAAIDLQEALDEEQEFFRQIRAAGFDVGVAGSKYPRCPVSLGMRRDFNSPLARYLRALRALGVEV